MKRKFIKTGAKPNQIILGIDFELVTNPVDVMKYLAVVYGNIEFYLLSVTEGGHPFAVLKNEQFDKPIPDEYLIDEWAELREVVQPPEAVRLWRGLPHPLPKTNTGGLTATIGKMDPVILRSLQLFEFPAIAASRDTDSSETVYKFRYFCPDFHQVSLEGCSTHVYCPVCEISYPIADLEKTLVPVLK